MVDKKHRTKTTEAENWRIKMNEKFYLKNCQLNDSQNLDGIIIKKLKESNSFKS